MARRIPARIASPHHLPFVVVFGNDVDNLAAFPHQFSKIGKVMRHIHALPNERVPRDDEFKFRERAKILVDKWHETLKSNGSSDAAKPATNGTHKAADAENAGVNGADSKENGTKAEAEDIAMQGEDAPANGVGDESLLADVTMSEAA